MRAMLLHSGGAPPDATTPEICRGFPAAETTGKDWLRRRESNYSVGWRTYSY